MKNSLEKTESLAILERGLFTALETYSNVHRGSGLKSMVTTHLFEQAREIILEYLGLDKKKHIVVFCTPRRAGILKKQIISKEYQVVSSNDIGLSIGVVAVAIKKTALPKGVPFQTGGGTTRLVSTKWVDWANAPDKFEAGTPAIINIIAFARALRLIKKFGDDIFADSKIEKTTINELLYQDTLDQFTGKELLAKLRKTLIGSNIEVPTMEGTDRFINLDNSASTPTFEPVWNTYRRLLHQSTQVQQEIIYEVQTICANLLGASLDEYEIIFTSNTTEAINLAAENLSLEFGKENENVVINSLMEHSSNDLPWRMVPNYSLIRLSVDADGFIDLNELETLLKKYNHQDNNEKKRVRIVAISGASNVLGSCNNISEISRVVHKYDAQLLVDAAQLIAHRKLDMKAGEIDYLTFSAHKVYAPFGCGALVVKKGLLKFSPPELDLIRTSGEENVAGIAALGKISILLQRIGMNLIQEEEQDLTAKALYAMSQIEGVKIYGINNHNHPEFKHKIGVIAFEKKNIMSSRVAKKLSSQSGIGVRYGCHCAHIIIKHLFKFSPGMETFQRYLLMMFPGINLPGLTRVSFGIENSEEDIYRLVQALKKIIIKPKGASTTEDLAKLTLTKTEVKKQIDTLVRNSSLKVYSHFE